jgi:hypothetical protein
VRAGRFAWPARVGLAAVALLLAACSDFTQSDTTADAVAPAGPVSRFEHAGGLVLDVAADGWSVTPTASGLQVEPVDAAQARNPWRITVELKPGPVPTVATAKSKALGRRSASYLVESSGSGGSGGEAQTMRAWVACGDGHIRATLTQQIEPPLDLDLDPAWKVLAGAGCPDEAGKGR